MKKKLDEKKLAHYLRLEKEAKYYAMSELEKQKKDHKFGKFVKKALMQLKKNK